MSPEHLRVAVPRLVVLVLVYLLAFSGSPARAERLSIRTFTSADGLGSSFVSHIAQDSAGYVWFATRDGLSRWNGYEFVTVARDGGLDVPALDRLIMTRSGEYFVIGNDGSLYSCRPAWAPDEARRGRICFRRRSVQVDGKEVRFSHLYEDSQGVLWGGGNGVLVRGIGATEIVIPLSHGAFPYDALIVVHAIVEDSAGALWIGTNRGLLRRLPDGRLCHYSLGPHAGGDIVNALAFDRGGRLWVGHHRLGVVVFNPEPAVRALSSQRLSPRALVGNVFQVDPRPGESVALTTANGLPGNDVASLLATPNGQVWVGTADGLGRFDGSSFARYTKQDGLCDNVIHGLAEDGDGNLWVATPTGAMRITLDGFSGYTVGEGLGTDHVVSIGETPAGIIYAVGIDWSVSTFDGRRFRPSRLALPKGSSLMWASQAGYRDRGGHWWALTNQGLYRFGPEPADHSRVFSLPDRHYTERDGLPSPNVFRVYEDRAGFVWVGTRSGDPLDDGLARFDAGLTRATAFGPGEGLPAGLAPSAFAEDGQGDLWVGFYEGGLARYRNGRFRLYSARDGVPPGMVTALLVDRRGRLWAATNLAGVARVDDPSADRMVVRTYASREGLTSANVRALAVDGDGGIFAGSVRGVDRLDPVTGHVRHFGPEDGLPGDFVTAAFCDSRGDLWLGTYRGAFRLRARDQRKEEPPPIAITGLRVTGRAYPVLELGQSSVDHVVLDPDQGDIAVEFVSVSRHRASGITYQYSMDGENGSWSLPSAARIVNFARLPPGRYRFAVRAVSAGSAVSATPATFEFTIRRPLWQRWWVVVLEVMMAAAAMMALYRYRVQRVLELERLRLGIASDLHDEVATNLSSIAMFSTLMKGEADQPSPFLDRITVLATESLQAIRDIIWSIDPQPETIAGLLERLRDAMVTSCRARGIQLTVLVPSEALQQNLTPEQRKNLWLMLKEAVTNALKHSGGTDISVIVTPGHRQVRISVRDNGKGTDGEEESTGRGLATMRARAAALGGTAVVGSEPGRGTTVEFVLPLAT